MTKPNDVANVRVKAMLNTIIGFGAAFDMKDQSRCTVVGQNVPAPEGDDTIRIGTGTVFLEIKDGKATIHGAEPDAAAQAFLDGFVHLMDVVDYAVERQKERMERFQ